MASNSDPTDTDGPNALPRDRPPNNISDTAEPDSKENFSLPPDDQPYIQKKLLANHLSRCAENTKFFNGSFSAVYFAANSVDDMQDKDNLDEISREGAIGQITGNGCGFLLDIIIYYVGKKLLKKTTRNELKNKQEDTIDNPLYRIFKTLASFGMALGEAIGSFCGPVLPNLGKKMLTGVVSNILAIAFGLLAFPYYFLIEIPLSKMSKYARNDKVGPDGLMKVAKASFSTGTAVGQIGEHSNKISTPIAAMAAFVLSLIIIPINKYYNRKKRTTDNEAYRVKKRVKVPVYDRDGELLYDEDGLVMKTDKIDPHTGKAVLEDVKVAGNYVVLKPLHSNSKSLYRTNYTRTGLIIGAALGTIFGGILSFFVPIPFLEAQKAFTIFFGGIGSVLGAVVLSVTGHRISQRFHGEKESDNSWDFVTRTTSYTGGSIGALLGFFIPLPCTTIIGVAIGTAIGSVVGWAAGLCVTPLARRIEPVEEWAKASSTLSWTQRVGTGSNLGAMIFGTIGLFVGVFFGGPLGLFGGLTVGAAIGGLLGTFAALVYDAKGRELLWQGMNKFKHWIFNTTPSIPVSAKTSTPSPVPGVKNKDCSTARISQGLPLGTQDEGNLLELNLDADADADATSNAAPINVVAERQNGLQKPTNDDGKMSTGAMTASIWAENNRASFRANKPAIAEIAARRLSLKASEENPQ